MTEAASNSSESYMRLFNQKIIIMLPILLILSMLVFAMVVVPVVCGIVLVVSNRLHDRKEGIRHRS